MPEWCLATLGDAARLQQSRQMRQTQQACTQTAAANSVAANQSGTRSTSHLGSPGMRHGDTPPHEPAAAASLRDAMPSRWVGGHEAAAGPVAVTLRVKVST